MKLLSFIVLGGKYDHIRGAQHFLKRYRDGLLGQLTFDDLIEKN